MKWRKWNIILHRDLGYLCAGLTIVYAVSGVAVNHRGDWNPTYKVEQTARKIGPVVARDPQSPAVVTGILRDLGLDDEYRDTFLRSGTNLEIFLEGGSVSVDLPTGDVVVESVRNRRILREMNFLHLNNPKKLWTYLADLYAVCLAVLAITGLFVLKGRNGITGRGAWLTGIGVALPLVFLFLYL